MKSRILFVHNHAAKFVQMDLAILRERYAVREWYQRSRAVNLPALIRAVAQTDLVFGWFASWHTFFPVVFVRALRRPAVLVVGGYDTANMPEIGYGSQRGGVKRQIARRTMRMATRLVAFSDFSRAEAIQNAGMPPDQVAMIYVGVEDCRMKSRPKERLVVTAGNVDRDNLQRKGLESFVRAAVLLPDIPFVVIGAWRDDAIDRLRSIAGPNVTFIGWISDEQLRDYFVRARVYVQASRHEGFGLAVAEAMLSECIPVVTRAGALPELVGETGVYLDSAAPEDIAAGVRRALELDEGTRARDRIVTQFPLAKRKQKLYALIDQVLHD